MTLTDDAVERKKRKLRVKEPKVRVVDPDAFSIEEFCLRHNMSVQLFYKYRNQMPATFRVGSRVLISREAAAAWRREREAAA